MKFSRLLTRIIDWFYIPPLRAVMPLQTFRYAVCGAVNYYGINLVLYYVTIHYIVCERDLDIGLMVLSPHIASLAIVFPITTFTGFWLNRNVAFKHSPLRHRTQALRYLMSVLISLMINSLCLKLFVDVLDIWSTPAQALSTAVVTVYSYLMQKYFTFRGCQKI